MREEDTALVNSYGDATSQNDAFSFWKLPEQWRASLEWSAVRSRMIAEWYLFERYSERQARGYPLRLSLYYGIKNFVPAHTRHFLRRLSFQLRAPRPFPKWPCEDALVVFWRDWLMGSLAKFGASDGWHIPFWPENKNCCVVITHDVDSAAGFQRMEAMAEIEDRYGFRSAWNLPLDQYPIDWTRVDRLRAQGFEVGAHGLRHDGMLFRSHRHFLALAPRLESLAREHGLRGFRSPSTFRRVEWLQTLKFDFDSSFSDSDPYEPQPGGSCSIFPFFIGEIVELPYTLPQDHTLINLLRRDPLPVWIKKIEWLESHGGLILTLTHPDYSGTGKPLHAYEELLKRLSEVKSSWRALPAQVAAWWRRRARLTLQVSGDQPRIVGTDGNGLVARRLSTEPILAAGR
jgi:peptidoglycan/xylan/chitin deacetylase (PgdA/CDA1 family)